VVHLSSGLPFNRYLIEIRIPQDVWDARMGSRSTDLPVGWDALPAGRVSLDFGDAWLRSGASAIIQLPSVVSPEDPVILINPAHPDAKRVTASRIRKWIYDPRLSR
jgi:RES domain-containing protein